MPFDPTPQDRLTLGDLAFRLRNPDTWPPGFKWDYGDCNACAMGMAWQLSGGKVLPRVPKRVVENIIRSAMADAEAMTTKEFSQVFWSLAGVKRTSVEDITPNDVADAIDGYLSAKVAA